MGNAACSLCRNSLNDVDGLESLTMMPTPQPRPGRPTSERVRRECVEVARRIGEAMGEHEIRRELGLSRRAYRHRLRVLHKVAHADLAWLWTRYVTASLAHVRALGEIVDAALAAEPPEYDTARRAIVDSSRVWRAIAETALALGVIAPGRRAEQGVGVSKDVVRSWFGEGGSVPPT